MSERFGSGPSQRGYVICTTQRSGSNYLCQLLTSTGVLGRPAEYFNGPGRRARGWTDYPDDPEAQLAMVLAHGATANGIYGFKIFAYQFDEVASTGWAERLPHLKWVYLERASLLDQAISLTIAKQTGQWRAEQQPLAAVRYDVDQIRDEMRGIAQAQARWRLFFARNGIQPLQLSYETLAANPQDSVDAVGSLVGVDEPAIIDPAAVTVRIQRDSRSDEWRLQFLADAGNRRYLDSLRISAPPLPGTAASTGARSPSADGPAHERSSSQPEATAEPEAVVRMRPRFADPLKTRLPHRPRLTVSIVTRDSEQRLERLLGEVAGYADEILVGVDAASSDRTFEIASQFADVIYRFQLALPGQLAPARMMALHYATGDWILSLDDDEGMEPGFEDILPDLLADESVTHFFFQRKWIVGLDPCEYLHGPPQHPNWALRLFRNDPALVWKPARPHSQYWVQGPGHFEERASLLHFEPVFCTPEQRREKFAWYRAAGGDGATEDQYEIRPETARRPARYRPHTIPQRRPNPIVDTQIHNLAPSEYPPWGSLIVAVDMPESARPGEILQTEVTARNTGILAWLPCYAQWPAPAWPKIRIGYHLLYPDGTPAKWEGERAQLPRRVAPGEEVRIIYQAIAPDEPGDYVLEWDMLEENTCWFALLGGTVLRTELRVRNA